MSLNQGFLEKTFKLSANKTDAKTEVIGGLTTFMTMAYILAVNPLILSSAGMDFNAVFTATALSSAVATLLMAFLANYPFALAPGMGLNAFFAFTVVQRMGYSWQFALTAVLIEGLLFILLSVVGVREAIFNSIPQNLKKGVSVGIGLFIAFIGLSNAGIINSEGDVLLQLGNITQGAPLLALIGVVITGILLAFKVKGALLFGIIATTIIGIPMGVTSAPTGIASLPPSLAPTFMKLDFSQVLSWDMAVVVISFLFVDLFDTLGTLIGVASKTDMLDEEGQLPRGKQALLADAIGTTFGAVTGTSTVTTYVESSSGVAEGARTGLASVVTAICFFLALFFSPIIAIIPSAATAPALILVGLFMLSPILEIDLTDYTESIPVFLTLLMMPAAQSIADGIAFGMISYVLLKLFSGRYKEISITMYILTLIFALKYVFL